MTTLDVPPADPRLPSRAGTWLAAGALLLALGLLLASAFALHLNLQRLEEGRNLVFRTNTILRKIVELQAHVREAETGQRGYLLTGETRYLAPYEAAVAAVPEDLRQLQELIQDPSQAQRFEVLPSLIAAKFDELALTITLRQESLDAALRVVRTDEGQRLMEEIDAALETLGEAERDLLEERTAYEGRAARETTRIATLEGLLALVGTVFGVVWLVRQRGQLRLARSEVRFRELAENIQEVFWMADPLARRVLYVNPAFEAVWGRSRTAFYQDIGVALDAVHPNDRTRVKATFFGHKPEGEYTETYRIVQPDGTVRWIRDRGWPVRDGSGRVAHVVGVAEDITDIQAAQEALRQANADLERRVAERTARLAEANQELDAFAYTISHDLRAPIRAMHGYAEALEEDYAGVLPDEGRRYVERIGAAALRMEALIADILTYSRLARDEVSLRPVSLDAVVEDVVSQAAPVIKESQAEVEIVRPLPMVRAHPRMLAQTIDNLLSNAMKFVAPGVRPKIRIEAVCHGGRVRVFVEDNAIGVDAAHHERIFRPFERLHGAEAYPGTGIGLGIVRRSIERMGGTCGVASHPGTGSRFWVELSATSEESPHGRGT